MLQNNEARLAHGRWFIIGSWVSVMYMVYETYADSTVQL